VRLSLLKCACYMMVFHVLIPFSNAKCNLLNSPTTIEGAKINTLKLCTIYAY
jgi:hypothetical protein